VISFRYHLVSIVAVFLALALGIVVGTTALNGPITKDLRNQVNDLKGQRDDLAAQVKSLRGQVDDADKFASTYGPQLVDGTLTDKDVLVITLPGVPGGMADGVNAELTASGAKVSGRVAVTKDYLDQRLGTQITSMATGPLHPVGVTYPDTSDAGQIGGSLLAYVLLGKGTSTDLTSVLRAFTSLHMLEVNGDVAPSTAVVVLGHGTMSANSYAGNSELSLVGALAKAGGHVVVAGDTDSAAGGGLVARVRDAAAEQGTVSTVDDAGDAFGQVSSVIALAATVAGAVGHYGTERGADALFPSPTK
jgi:hypothetical protein